MRATFLKNERAKQFFEITGIRAKNIIIYQNRQYYYAIVIDNSFCVRIDKETAIQFI